MQRAASLTVAAVRFGQRILSGNLGPITAGSQRMDGYQFPRMFAATRVPVRGRDRWTQRVHSAGDLCVPPLGWAGTPVRSAQP